MSQDLREVRKPVLPAAAPILRNTDLVLIGSREEGLSQSKGTGVCAAGRTARRPMCWSMGEQRGVCGVEAGSGGAGDEVRELWGWFQ